MKILIRNSDNVVIYALGDMNLTTEALETPEFIDKNFNTTNARLENADLPEVWAGGTMSYANGAWAVTDQVSYDLIKAEFIAKKKESFTKMVQKRLDDFAATRGYDNIASACSYISSGNAQFAAEAATAIALRDATWTEMGIIDAEIDANTTPAEITFDEVLARLPTLAW